LATSAVSAEMFALPLEPELALELDDAGALAAAELDVPELAAAELLELELLDEHAASRTAAPTAVIPNATRVARGLCLPCCPSSFKRFMRPRI
jgi:hypothetical protein